MRHEEVVAQALKNPEVQAAYDALEPEFSLLADMIKAVGLSQAQVAARMGIIRWINSIKYLHKADSAIFCLCGTSASLRAG